ncbi:hypothetical protein [Azomonas macrocytogenes]|uniref:Uncharacterized protein n=1 Tax=Azomonas macrocytogenes TaxID=69962 RepID=A0A839T6E5_AZOMA|nr:hypothetical protein [Azomonas macrocytogenes]MBB3103253.1 hypothetical protein [Azomonas macrocytogenes]
MRLRNRTWGADASLEESSATLANSKSICKMRGSALSGSDSAERAITCELMRIRGLSREVLALRDTRCLKLNPCRIVETVGGVLEPVDDLLRVGQTALKPAWIASPVEMLIYHP